MVRKYSIEDKHKVIELLRKNTPEFFHVSEEKDFESYLDHEIEDYFVYQQQDKIIGAGGINYITERKVARISWDIIDPKAHGKGIGKELVQYRINLLNKNPNIDFIEVRTSQLTNTFYEKMGFSLQKVEKDFWAKNFDLYQMQMKNKG